MPRFSNIPPKRIVKKNVNYPALYQGQRMVLIDIIEKELTISRASLQIKSTFGDGTFNRRISEVIQLYPDINYNSHTKIFTDTKAQIDKPLTAEVKEGLV